MTTRDVLNTRILSSFRILKILFLFAIMLFLVPKNANAAASSISLYPSSGYAQLGQDFAIDIMLDTGGQDTTETKVVLEFDPGKVEVTKAQHGDLYCQYPEDGYSVNNTDGVVMITGFCLDPYYNSGNDSGLFARITFKPKVEGDVTFKFNYNGSDQEWNTHVKDVGSPPENVLDSHPGAATYTVVSGGGGKEGGGTKLPGVGKWNNRLIIGGSLLILIPIVVFTATRLYKLYKARQEV